jgi:hypothetical protein
MRYDQEGVPKEPCLRRWQDKIVCGLAFLIIGLIGVVYASVKNDMTTFDSIQRANVERIVKLEEHQTAVKDDLTEIKTNQNDIQRTLTKILIGLKLEK